MSGRASLEAYKSEEGPHFRVVLAEVTHVFSIQNANWVLHVRFIPVTEKLTERHYPWLFVAARRASRSFLRPACMRSVPCRSTWGISNTRRAGTARPAIWMPQRFVPALRHGMHSCTPTFWGCKLPESVTIFEYTPCCVVMCCGNIDITCLLVHKARKFLKAKPRQADCILPLGVRWCFITLTAPDTITDPALWVVQGSRRARRARARLARG